MKEIVLDLIFCFAATLFFALIMNAPKKTLVATSIIASIGYVIYITLSKELNVTLGFFAGTTFIAMQGEVLARKHKMPATIFIFPAVIAMVPGLGLYQTMLALVQNDIQHALEIGANTILNIAAMAVAMAFVSVFALKMKSRKMN
jgi:uncharacterized membrane protein YjjB (DUF3815 family)